MAIVWFSHLGETPFENKEKHKVAVNGTTVLEIVNELESKFPGLREILLSKSGAGDCFDVSTRIYHMPKVDEDAIEAEVLYLPEDATIPIENLLDPRPIGSDDPILISILRPEKYKQFLESALMEQKAVIELPSPNGEGALQKIKVKGFLRKELPLFKEQKILAFCPGESTLGQLIQAPGRKPEFKPNPISKKPLDYFDRSQCKVMPKRLAESICKIWPGVDLESRLRLFQEDAYFFILSKLQDPTLFGKKHLLLSAPTGGGKTEAFLFPLLAHILFQRDRFLIDAAPGETPPETVRTLVLFPTKALANDQTKRMMELLYYINQGMPENQFLTIGILTGDTPRNEHQLRYEPLVQICPACGHADLQHKQDLEGKHYIECQHPGCPAKTHKYCRLTVQDIMQHPPDILVTNPDTIGVSLQNPQRRKLFNTDLETIVFDEIHLYDGVFGCNVSHLLRRLEACTGTVPLYVGLSATIENATDLAALMFDSDPADILYLREDSERPYQYEDGSGRVRYHAIARPADYQNIIRSCLNTAMAIAHSFVDPANRKALIFANKTDDVDRLVTYLDEAETKYFQLFIRDVLPKIEGRQSLNKGEQEALSEVGQWFYYLSDCGNPFLGAVYPGWHRGALEKKQRLEAINRFMSLKPIETGGNLEYPIDIMVATKTLELGIDIGSVATVINCSAPLSSNEYYQRIGRGGRRGNSLALTILNDTGALDAYFAAKFEQLIDNPEFEAIPIIVTNKIIARQHVIGSILDLLAEIIAPEGEWEIKVKHLRKLSLDLPGQANKVSLEEDPEKFGKALFHHLLKKRSIRVNGKDAVYIDKYINWLKRECKVLGVAPTDIDADLVEKWLVKKCQNIREHCDLNNKETYWDDEKSLSNYFSAVDRDLLTPLRGDGATVAIYAKEKNQDKFIEEVSRMRAVRSFPPAAYARQGLNSFQIQQPVKKEDTEVQEELVDLFWDEPVFLEYFGEKFPSNFPKNTKELRHFSSRVVVPDELQVNYAPYRFYCDKSGCFRTYTHHEVNENLLCHCNRPLKQLSQFIMCPHCGNLMEPPVPKVCINPSCIKKKLDSDPKFLVKLRGQSTYDRPEKPLFRFKSLAKLHWRCVDCGVVFNFYDYHRTGMLDDPRLREVKDAIMSGAASKKMDLETPVGIALKFLYFPEHYKRWDQYISMGYRPAMFKHWARYGGCDGVQSGMRIVNIPKVTTIQHRYLKKIRDLDEPMNVSVGKLEIFELKVVDLAREFTRSYDKGIHYTRREKTIITQEIFDNKFLANVFETHAFGLTFGDVLEKYLSSDRLPKECHGLCTTECTHLSKLKETIREIYVPKMEVAEWEVSEGKPRTPDPRQMWCPKAGSEDCVLRCVTCSYFGENARSLRVSHLRYILLHTLKHAIVWALPKYVGINQMGLSGQVYPNQNNIRNDDLKAELVIMDSAENGSGAMLLVKRNWERIWEFAETSIKLALEGKGNINLPYTCFRFNRDLCPMVASGFMEFVHSKG